MTARYVLRRRGNAFDGSTYFDPEGTWSRDRSQAVTYESREMAGHAARNLGATVVKLVRKPRVVRVTREQLKAAAKAWSKSLDAAVVWRRLPKATRATLCSAMRVCFTAAGFEVES